MRKYYWYFTTYVRKHGLTVIISIIAAIALFSLTIPWIVHSLQRKEHEYVGVIGTYTLSDLPPQITHRLSSGLTKIEPDGSVVPALAERWSVEDDGKTYRFILPKGLIWSDGTPITIDQITYKLSGVETITTPNDIIFKLPEPFAPFPQAVAKPIFKESTEKYMFFFQRPTLVGTGPYVLSDYAFQGTRLKELVIETDSDRTTYRFYLTENDAITAFKRGEIDVLQDLSNPGELALWKSTTVSETLRTDRYLAVFFNTNHSLFQKNVRQALSYTIQKPTDETRSLGPINPESWAYLQGGKTYAYDLERGIERLLDTPPAEPLQFELTTTSTFGSEAERMKQQWEVFGEQAAAACQNSSSIKDKNLCENMKIKVTIRVNNFPDTSNFQALLIGQESPSDPDQYSLWHSQQTSNFTGYKNTRIDSLLEKGRQTINRQERLEVYQEFQQFFLEDAPAIFIRHLKSYEVRRR